MRRSNLNTIFGATGFSGLGALVRGLGVQADPYRIEVKNEDKSVSLV